MLRKLRNLLTILVLSTVLLIGCGGTDNEAIPSENAINETTSVSDDATTDKTVDAAPTVSDELIPEASEEPTPEATEEPIPEPSEETADSPAPEQTEDSSAEPSAEPVPEPQAIYTYTDMTATMYATQTVNVRNLPDTAGEQIGSLSVNQEITVLGQCNETGWYKFELNGQTAFVSNSYLSTERVEVAPPAQEAPQITTQYNVGWNDMQDWFVYIQPSLDCPENNVNGAFWEEIKTILQERYPGCNTAGPIGIRLADGTSTAWLISIGGTHSYDYPQALLDFIAIYQY